MSKQPIPLQLTAAALSLCLLFPPQAWALREPQQDRAVPELQDRLQYSGLEEDAKLLLKDVRILIVDDDIERQKDLVRLVLHIFRQADYRLPRGQIGVFEGVPEAAEWLGKNKPQIVVTDLHLSPGNGFEVADQAKKKNKSAAVLLVGRPIGPKESSGVQNYLQRKIFTSWVRGNSDTMAEVIQEKILSRLSAGLEEGGLVRSLDPLGTVHASTSSPARREFSPGRAARTVEGTSPLQESLAEFFRTLAAAAPQGMTPVLIAAGLEEQYPQFRVLAAVRGSPLRLSSGNFQQDLENLDRQNIGSVVFVGLEEQAVRLRVLADHAKVSVVRTITPHYDTEFVPFILAILAESAGLEESKMAAQKRFGDMLDTVTLSGQL